MQTINQNQYLVKIIGVNKCKCQPSAAYPHPIFQVTVLPQLLCDSQACFGTF